ILTMTERLRYLFHKHLARTLTAAERTELNVLVLDEGNDAAITDLLNKAWDGSESEGVSREARKALLEKIQAPVVSIRPGKRWIPWVAAAACVAGLLVIGLVLFNNAKQSGQHPVAFTEPDVSAPQSSKARIVMSNGQSVSIDSLSAVTDGLVTVTKDASGNIVYSGSDNELRYNTLVNPRGSPVATTRLADGTQVWLNAGSSIRYFASNAGRERRVEVSGEAYFEVAKDKMRPFIVSKGHTAVTVLGTHFNVNAYDDDPSLNVTLLEGAVRVDHRTAGENIPASVVIRPGEQVTVSNANSRMSVNKKVNIDEVMAWKNGLFGFNRTDLKTVMRQLTRWYDVQVEYKGKIPSLSFGGEMERTLKLSQVLKLLEQSEVHFRIEPLPAGGQKIIVTP
ncbi:MAG: FecR domain-containing protein, partial [Chitinophagaceae bacterium]